MIFFITYNLRQLQQIISNILITNRINKLIN